MKKILSILLLCVSLALSAQNVPDNFISRRMREVPQRAATNVHIYEFGPLYDSPAPKGYKPFYISHYGRHGARTNSDGHDIVRLEKQLSAAEADGALSENGQYVLGVTREIVKRHRGMGGRLTDHGRWEHGQLAERMYKRYPAVFRKGSKKIDVISSTVPRCLVSMAAFTNKLVFLQKDLEFDIDTGEKYMEYISKASGDAIKAEAEKISDSLRRLVKSDTLAFLKIMLKNPADGPKYFPSAKKAVRDLYSAAKATEALDIKDNLFRFFPEEYVYSRMESSCMNIYFCQSNSELLGNRRLPKAERLVNDIITRADKAIADGEPCADLRFGHDWPFVGLVSYLGLEGVSRRMDLETARNCWDASLYTPFAANLQIIFYRAKGKDVLVKFLMNEKETLIPELTAVQGPYYKWEDVKAMCAKPVSERF